MRGTIPDLPTPHPLIGQLPVVYLEHDFLDRFLAALDEVLAPALLTLDSLPAYLDPQTAPADFLGWLAGWLGVDLGAEPADGDRTAVAAAVDRHRWRGTRRGLADLVRQECGVAPKILETGSVTWSADPGAQPAAPSQARVTVRIRLADPGSLNRARLERLVAAEVPAHIGFDVEILPAGDEP